MHKQKGFTFIELIIAVFVTLLLTGIMVVSFRNGERQKRLTISSDIVVKALEKAKTESLSGKQLVTSCPDKAAKSYIVDLSVSNSFYTLYGEDTCGNLNSIERIDLPADTLVESISVVSLLGTSTPDSVKIKSTLPFAKFQVDTGDNNYVPFGEIQVVMSSKDTNIPSKTVLVDGVTSRVTLDDGSAGGGPGPTPPVTNQGSTKTVTITTEYLDLVSGNPPSVSFGPGVNLTGPPTIVDQNVMRVDLSIAEQAPVGVHTVLLSKYMGGTVTKNAYSDAFTVNGTSPSCTGYFIPCTSVPPQSVQPCLTVDSNPVGAGQFGSITPTTFQTGDTVTVNVNNFVGTFTVNNFFLILTPDSGVVGQECMARATTLVRTGSTSYRATFIIPLYDDFVSPKAYESMVKAITTTGVVRSTSASINVTLQPLPRIVSVSPNQ